jgi:hypothetical protein
MDKSKQFSGNFLHEEHSLKNPVMRGVTIEFSMETIYLGVVLEDKLL